MNAHAQSAALLASIPQAMRPTERLSVPDMIQRLKAERHERAVWQMVAQKSTLGSKAEADAADAAAACDDREYVLAIAIKAAVDLALEPLGLTFSALQELDL